MRTLLQQGDSKQRWIPVEQLRAGDTVNIESDRGLVIMIEKADQEHVLVAYEGRDEVDYPAGTRLMIEPRQQFPTEDNGS